ncbi:MAG: hypothetical protein BGP16_17855 [Sphingobium sp. 66-54]|nr:MAG: hypothetical protein BGP16_17855 [Sphingobium sp. 66-54]
MEHRPSWRKPAGMFAILAIIAVWAVIVASFAPVIAGWPRVVQMIVYIVAGIVWIFPTRPLLQWMETGRWRP